MELGLSEKEFALVENTEWLYVKSEIIKKVIGLFTALSEVYVGHATNNLSSVLINIPPKISRGDNYKGLPFIMLDYPRNFQHNNILAIRSFFWWGNFFSISIHLKGEMQQRYAKNIADNLKSLNMEGWMMQQGLNEWEHTFENNYVSIDPLENYRLKQRPFIKVAKKIPLQEWDNLPLIFSKNFSFLLKILS